MKLCVIPARQGSKRLPRKNVLPLAGRPLVARAVDCAVQAGVFDRVVVTTDDPEVAEAVRGLVCEVRARPPALAGDAATLSEVLVALLAELAEDGASVDLIALLLPTSPLRTADDVRASLAVLEADPQANGVLSVTEYEHTPQWAYCVRDGRVVPYWAEFISQPRGDLEPLVRHDGSIMWLRASELRARGDYHFPMAPYRIPPERAVDVDTPLDFAFAEFLLSRGGACVTLRLLASASAFYFWVQPYDLAAYVALLRGLDLPFAGIDLYLDANPAAALPAFDDASRRYLAELELRAVHIDLFRFDWRTAVDEAQLSAALRYVGQFARDVEATHLVVHGEFLGRDAEERCARMRAALPEGVVLAAELVAEGGCYATHPDHLERALAADPELQLVPDTAHMQDFDYPWQQVFLNPTLRARICMVHTSNHARHLGESLYGDTREGREAVHALCIADEGRFPPDYLRELRRYPLVLEGIVPRGAEGVELLRREVAFLTGAAAREEGP